MKSLSKTLWWSFQNASAWCRTHQSPHLVGGRLRDARIWPSTYIPFFRHLHFNYLPTNALDYLPPECLRAEWLTFVIIRVQFGS
jgi:hypothetical protein